MRGTSPHVFLGPARERLKVRGNRSDPGIFSLSASRDRGSHILDGGLEHAILGNALVFEEENAKCEPRSWKKTPNARAKDARAKDLAKAEGLVQLRDASCVSFV